MPYELIRLEDGTYKVCKKDKSKCFSKKGIPKKRAIKQLKAIGMSEHKKLTGGVYTLPDNTPVYGGWRREFDAIMNWNAPYYMLAQGYKKRGDMIKHIDTMEPDENQIVNDWFNKSLNEQLQEYRDFKKRILGDEGAQVTTTSIPWGTLSKKDYWLAIQEPYLRGMYEKDRVSKLTPEQLTAEQKANYEASTIEQPKIDEFNRYGDNKPIEISNGGDIKTARMFRNGGWVFLDNNNNEMGRIPSPYEWNRSAANLGSPDDKVRVERAAGIITKAIEDRKNRSGFDKFMDGLNDFLIDLADIGTQIIDVIGGGTLGKVASEAYKTFRPPKSKEGLEEKVLAILTEERVGDKVAKQFETDPLYKQVLPYDKYAKELLQDITKYGSLGNKLLETGTGFDAPEFIDKKKTIWEQPRYDPISNRMVSDVMFQDDKERGFKKGDLSLIKKGLEDWKAAGKPKKLNLLELFKGTGSVGKVAKKDFNVISLDLDPISTPDIETDILKWNYKKFYKDTQFVPNFIWASPPCNTFSPLAYPLKERNTKTAEPLSDRAKLGTQILHKTLEIIKFFQKINPNLLFVIENPKGMMRNDSKIKKLMLNSTYYCLYGDKRQKHTDFFSNFNLDLKEPSKCKNKTVGVVNLPLNERYKIPPKLIKHIFEQYFKYSKLKGGYNSYEQGLANQQRLIDMETTEEGKARRRAQFAAYNKQYERTDFLQRNIFGHLSFNDIAGTYDTPEEKERFMKFLEDGVRAEGEEKFFYHNEKPITNLVDVYSKDGSPAVSARFNYPTGGWDITYKDGSVEHTLGYRNKDFFDPLNKTVESYVNKMAIPLAKKNLENLQKIEEERKSKMSSSDKFFEGVNDVLTNIADVAAEFVPINKLITETYKTFRPQTSSERSANWINENQSKYENMLMNAETLGETNAKLFKGRLKGLAQYDPVIQQEIKDLDTKGTKLHQALGGNIKEYMNKELYLKIARQIAKRNKYNPKLLELANDGKHKLVYNGVKFGSLLNNDYIIYSYLAKRGDITQKEADEHRRKYLARATKIKGNWKDNIESPNNLAIRILW